MAMLISISILLFVATGSLSQLLPSRPPNVKSVPTHGGNAGEALYLSKYIKSGDVQTARDLSLVTDLTPNITSYSGFLTVNESCNAQLFFWFFPSQNDWLKDPVAIWLQGGPGSSSMFGLLTENGPYALSMEGELSLREHSWNRNSSIIFIDSPVGTGFSQADLRCYVTNQEEVGRDVLNALNQFFVLFPEIRENPFYVTGESYGGKYVPAVSYAIYKSDSSINLLGLAIGNGLPDPVSQLNYADFMYEVGFVDSASREAMKSIEENIRENIRKGEWTDAHDNFSNLLDYFSVKSGITSFYNYLFADGEATPNLDDLFAKEEVRRAIHVGNATWHGMTNFEVYMALYDDFMKSVKPWVEELLETDLRIVIYNGQFDIICGYPMEAQFIDTLNWSGAHDWIGAERKIWRVNNELAGYSKTVKGLTEVLVRNAGHMVPTNQPTWALDLYNKFIFNMQFDLEN